MLKKITENVEIHQTLPDIPNLTSEELKKEWDKGNRIIKQAFNELIDSLNDAKVEELKEKNIITAKGGPNGENRDTVASPERNKNRVKGQGICRKQVNFRKWWRKNRNWNY